MGMGIAAQMENMDTGQGTVIVGLGATGLSCARFLRRQGIPFAIADSRSEPPFLQAARDEMPDVEIALGDFDPRLLARATRLIVSPGVSLAEPVIAAAGAAGVEVLNDIELFARHVDAPVIAITGSNGKSTVTTLVGEMAREAEWDVRVGGNIGTPALDLLGGAAPRLYVLELSSFQLELTQSLYARGATVLNVSDDHLDRHGDLKGYAGIKQRIFRGDGVMVLNGDDPLVAAMGEPGRRTVCFGLKEPVDEIDYGVRQEKDKVLLMRGKEALLTRDELRIPGRHNLANALAALALGESLDMPRQAMLAALRSFSGLPHRCQWVAERRDVNWYNDSKGTNVGATLAAIAGMPGKRVVLIAGGLGKGADFKPLREVVAARGRAVVLIGQDAPVIEKALRGVVPVLHASGMGDAVTKAADLAKPGDSVLLSPACASFDMFSGYAQRGQIFIDAVKGLGE